MSKKEIYHKINLDELSLYLTNKPDVIHCELEKDSQIIGLLILYFNDKIYLSGINIYEEHQNKGYAKQILKVLTRYSNDSNIIIELCARAMDQQKGDLNRLVNLYKQFGFQIIDDHPVFARMIYHPKIS